MNDTEALSYLAEIIDAARAGGAPREHIQALQMAREALGEEIEFTCAEKVTKVVRCKDCIHWDKRTTNKNGFDICPASSMEIHERDYCSYGERKGGADNAE